MWCASLNIVLIYFSILPLNTTRTDDEWASAPSSLLDAMTLIMRIKTPCEKTYWDELRGERSDVSGRVRNVSSHASSPPRQLVKGSRLKYSAALKYIHTFNIHGSHSSLSACSDRGEGGVKWRLGQGGGCLIHNKDTKGGGHLLASGLRLPVCFDLSTKI